MEVKTIPIILSIKDGFNAQAIKKKIKGILKSVIISTNKSVDICIELEEQENVYLYDVQHYNGTSYIPLKVMSENTKGEKWNFSPGDWTLDNKLKINITGQKDTNVKFVFYYI